VATAVRRYGPGGEFWAQNPQLPLRPVVEWPVWNKQNAQHFWRRKPSPRRYVALLRLTSTTIKRVDAKRTGCARRHVRIPEQTALDLQGLPEAAVQRGVHAATLRRGRATSVGGTLRLLRAQIQAARQIMDRSGDGETPILVTELGWSTAGPRKWPLVTTPSGQAKLLKRSFGLLLRQRGRWGIEGVVWFAWRVFTQDLCRWCGGAGLLNLNGDREPAWSRFKGFTSRTVDRPPAAAR
jgi:hypothetical protein